MDRYQSEATTTQPEQGMLEAFLCNVLSRIHSGLSLEELLGLLRQPIRTFSTIRTGQSLLQMVKQPDVPSDEAILDYLMPDFRDLPDLSNDGRQRLRTRVMAEVMHYRTEDPQGDALEQCNQKRLATLRCDTERRRVFLHLAKEQLPEPCWNNLRLWAEYLEMKAELNETHALYRGRCFCWFSRIGFRPKK